MVVAERHDVRIWDLERSDSPRTLVDLRAQLVDWKSKESIISAIEWRAPIKEKDEPGTVVWLGTTEGHLLALDTRTGQLASIKAAAHTDTVTHIFRHGTNMLSMDVSGKVLVFSPDETGSFSALHAFDGMSPPRVIRGAERQDFVAMLGGCLWTSSRAEKEGHGHMHVHSHHTGSSVNGGMGKGPAIKVTEILRSGATARTVLPKEHLGAVLCGVAMDESVVMLGHEGGHVSVWDCSTEGPPMNTDVVRIGVSDVSCLEAVGGRLWTAGRKGSVEVYEVGLKPWVCTNAWVAHGGMPVLRVKVDAYSLEKMGRLLVGSVGRDERIRFWDGMLGVDWVGECGLKFRGI